MAAGVGHSGPRQAFQGPLTTRLFRRKILEPLSHASRDGSFSALRFPHHEASRATHPRRIAARNLARVSIPVALGAESAAFTYSAPHAILVNDVLPPSDSAQVFVLSPILTTVVFLIGVFPFIIATIEFWRRIAVGDPFGTGSDSVVFPQNQQDSGASADENKDTVLDRRRVLGQDALIAAYFLFAVAASVLSLVLYSVGTSTVITPPDPLS
jgi:hypothetical protein